MPSDRLPQVGTFAPSTTIVHVGERGADLFDFFHACQATQAHFLVRAAQNRRTTNDDAEIGDVLDQARAWPSQQSHSFEVPASHGRQARTTQLQLSFGPMRLLAPRNEPRANKQPFCLWVLRLWEEEQPAGEEPLEWTLFQLISRLSPGARG